MRKHATTSSMICGLMIAIFVCSIGVANASTKDTDPSQSSSSFDELASSCVGFTNTGSNSDDADTRKSKAELCEKVSGLLKNKLDAESATIKRSRDISTNAQWRFFSSRVLIIFDLVALLLLAGILIIYISSSRKSGNSNSTPEFLKDIQGKVSFSRVIGAIGATGLVVTSLFFVNFIGIHFVLYNSSPENLAALLSPMFVFLPTLVPYIFAKRDEASIAANRAGESQ